MEFTPIGTTCFVVAYLESFLELTFNVSKPCLQKFQKKSVTQTLPELKLEVKKG